MSTAKDGNAIVYCEGAFNTPNGKTAHGLVRFTERYRVLSVIDSRWEGSDAGQVLDGHPSGIPVVSTLDSALSRRSEDGKAAERLVIGLAPDGGRLPESARETIYEAIHAGLHVDAGLHDYLGDDPEFSARAAVYGVELRDVRRPIPTKQLHFFTGKIEEVSSTRIAVLGTDSAVGKRTTAVKLSHALQALGISTELIGTGQTAWMQGIRYGIILDSLIADFMAGEIEHVVWRAWNDCKPMCLVLEGQGSLMNPAYPGGYELLAAGRPHGIVLQHAPARREYDGFPGFPIEPLEVQIQALELVSKRPVVAITLNHEGMNEAEARTECERIQAQTGLPCTDVLLDGAEALARTLADRLQLGPRP